MTQRKLRRGRRPAFTLIELLVVIAIIAILIGLIGAAVMRVLVKGPELQTFSEINLMGSKLTGEQKDLNIPILPSHLRLREDSNYADTVPGSPRDNDLKQTKAFLQQAFGRHVTDPGTQIDWNGDTTITTTAGAGGDLVLEGEQCLVFWLGGVPQFGANGAIAMRGFPALVSGGASGKRGPFYEFQIGRLQSFQAIDPLNGNALSLKFPVYIDPWKAGLGRPWGPGMPYVYFASYRTEGTGLYQADCASIGQAAAQFNPPSSAPAPYQDSTGKWLNAGSFQILSAGRDGLFGPGGVFNATTGNTGPLAAKDDQSNFSPRLLGAPAN